MLLNFNSKKASTGNSGDFTFRLPQPVFQSRNEKGDPEGRLSLISANIYNTVQNIPNSFTITYDISGQTNNVITIGPAGTWTFKTLLQEIERQNKELNTLDETDPQNPIQPFKLTYISAMGKIYLTVNHATNIVFSNDALRYLGATTSAYNSSQFLENLADIFPADVCNLNCSMVSSSRNNGLKSQIIASIPLAGPPGSIINFSPNFKTKLLTDENRTDQIRFYFTDKNDQIINFQNNPPITISLLLENCQRGDYCSC